MTSHGHSHNDTIIDNNNSRSSNNNSNNLIIQYMKKYQSFLKKNRFALKIVEDLISRFVLYAPSRFGNSNGDNGNGDNGNGNGASNKKRGLMPDPETLYAIINLWSLMNDSIYYGLGNDNGLTVGALSGVGCTTESAESAENTESADNTNRKEDAITLLRSILSIVDCLAPALEVRAYSSSTTSTSTAQQHGRMNKHKIKSNVLDVLTNIERIKFICRFSILLLNYSTYYWKSKSISKSISNSNSWRNSNRNSREDSKSNDTNKDTIIDTACISTFGILKDGGLYDLGGEDAIPIENEIKRVKRMLYVGKRTGRKIMRMDMYTNDVAAAAVTSNENQVENKDDSNNKNNKNTYAQIKWKKIINSSQVKIGMIAIGEFLHLVRPLYSIQSYRFHEKQFFQHDNDDDNGTITNQDQIRRRRKMMTMKMKTWFLSLMIDIASHKCTQFGTTVKKKIRKNGQHASASTDTHTTYDGFSNSNLHDTDIDTDTDTDVDVDVNISSQLTKDELYQRKMRLMLYLLRSPVFDYATYPISQSLSNILNHIPLIGQPISCYMMDLLTYWQQWHFMMES